MRLKPFFTYFISILSFLANSVLFPNSGSFPNTDSLALFNKLKSLTSYGLKPTNLLMLIHLINLTLLSVSLTFSFRLFSQLGEEKTGLTSDLQLWPGRARTHLQTNL
jgi:hypothetical protein